LKKKLIGFLIMTLVVSNIAFLNTSSVHAETIDSTTTTNNKIKVSLENIRDIMTDNNLDIKMLDNKLKIARETYKEAKDAIEDKPSKPNSTDNDNYEADLAAYTKELASYNAAEAAYEKAKDNIKTARDNYEKGVESKVITAEQDYINYLGTLSEKQLQMDTAKSTERDAKILKIKYDSGFISNKEYVNSTITNTESNDALKKAINDEALQRTKLCNELGVSADEIIIDTDINEDFMEISKINYEDDLETMLNNNKSIQAASDNIDNLDEADDESSDNSDYTDTINDYNMDNAKIELKQSKIDAGEKFKAQYNTLMSSYNSTKSSYDKIIEKQKEYKTNQIKYDYGFASKNDTDDAKVTFEKDSNDFIKKRNQCYLDYLKYIQMKEGY
jgi:hypothetical protein